MKCLNGNQRCIWCIEIFKPNKLNHNTPFLFCSYKDEPLQNISIDIKDTCRDFKSKDDVKWKV